MTSTALPRRQHKTVSELLRGDFGRVLVHVLCWQLAMTLLGVLMERMLGVGGKYTGDVAPAGANLLTHTYRWDSGWFRDIVLHWYQFRAQEPVFYPVFPLAVLLVNWLSLGTAGLLVSGLVVNTVSSWLAVTALVKIVRYHVDGPHERRLALLAFLAAPAAFFLHMFYSEAVFVAFAFWAYLFALRRQWRAMALCMIPMMATRVTAVLFLGLCFLEFWRAGQWRPRALLSWNLLWFPVGLAGLGLYALFLHAVTGDALGMFTAYHKGPDWAYHVFNLNFPGTILDQVRQLWRELTGVDQVYVRTFTDRLLPLPYLAVTAASSVYLLVVRRSAAVPLAAFGFASIVMFTLNSNLISVYRYLLPCITIYIALAELVGRRPSWRYPVYGLLVCGGAFQVALVATFVCYRWAG
ncbi:mannosyltransferase family protein [Kutzneria albida]|uniref:Integral membrane protein n=1 Tax=Kutzneria albida DSM 43870 TaxID=1449976 RepID=W5WEI4_9PSEU|nr:mannosyltransferase family protein [Kutzneria albida]AHH99603.1 hypothetical protein KALB_6243 [Kutzneria albida DSM 43870]